ncbi:hypothetical protein BH11ACT1_BH11ACT1_32010 [soil metagenome]
MSWEQGRSTIEDMLRKGTLERVPPSIDAAQSLLEVAERHLASALVLADNDVVLAYDALHGANRKALTAILVAQGLRPTRAGGHIAVYEAVHAQLEPPLGRDLATYNRVRRTRNAGDYRDEHEAVANDVIADHPGCQKIVDIAKRVIGQMPPF